MQNKEEFIIKFYNRVSGNNVLNISDIPQEAINFISHYDHEELIIPFFVETVLTSSNRKSRESYARMFRVKPSVIRSLGIRLGIYSG